MPHVTDSTDLLQIIFVIGAFGLLGGFANFLVTRPCDSPPNRPSSNKQSEADAQHLAKKLSDDDSQHLAKCLVLGVAAAFVVPLFLQTIQSELLLKSAQSNSALLTFGGLCLLAAFSSKPFLDSMAKKALKEARESNDKAKELEAEVDDVRSEVDAVAAKNTDTEIEQASVESEPSTSAVKVDSKCFEVLKALISDHWTFRTVAGLAKETKLTEPEVTGCLSWLKQSALANQRGQSSGATWYATRRGRILISSNPGPGNLRTEPK